MRGVGLGQVFVQFGDFLVEFHVRRKGDMRTSR